MIDRFVAQTPWQPDRPETLVICCSDGRWHAQVEEFIRAQVSERADVYAVPGGPAGFYWWNSSFEDTRVMEKAFRFLADHHDIRSVWLIAHEDCAFYKSQCAHLKSAELRERQEADLERVCEIIEGWYSGMAVYKVFASREQDGVLFTVLPAGRLRQARQAISSIRITV